MLRAVSASGGAPGNFSTFTVTGQGLFADGTGVAPSIAFSNDPGMGVFRAGSGQIGVSISGGNSFSFYGSGVLALINTGVLGWSGNNNPLGALDVQFLRDAIGLVGIKNSIAIRGGAGFGAKALSGSYSVTQDDFTLMCSTATSGLTVLLPLSPAMNQLLNIKKVSADANRLTIDGNGNLIDALSMQSTIATNRPNFQLQFGSTIASPTGSAWAIL